MLFQKMLKFSHYIPISGRSRPSVYRFFDRRNLYGLVTPIFIRIILFIFYFEKRTLFKAWKPAKNWPWEKKFRDLISGRVRVKFEFNIENKNHPASCKGFVILIKIRSAWNIFAHRRPPKCQKFAGVAFIYPQNMD